MTNLLPLILALTAARAADIPATGRVAAVTVYADRALVTRTVTVQVEPGEHAIVMSGLPAALVEDSLSASVKSGPVRLGGIELRRRFAPEAGDERVRGLEREIEKLDARLKDLANKVEVDRKMLEFADRLQALEAEKAGRDAGSGRTLNTAEWDAAIKYLSGLRTARMSSILATEADQRELTRTIEAKKRELAQIRTGRPGESRTAALLVTAKDGGEAVIDVRYVVPGAGWRPAYDARGDVAKKEVELTYFGMVIQQTGEPWEDVDLALSTARPSLGASMPELSPVFLSAAAFAPKPVYRAKSARAGGAMMAEMPSAAPMDRAAGFEAPPPQGGWETGEVETSGVSAVYKLPRRQTVPSANEPRRITIGVDKLAADLAYETTPKLAPLAYLRAKCTNTTSAPLLPGPVNAFLAGDFLGQSRIEITPQGAELPLQLGADERIKVKRERVAEKARETWWGKKLVIAQAYRLVVENFTGASQTVTVIDQVPVSQEASIEVRAFKAEPAPTEKSEEKGELRWKLNLKAGEKRIVEFSYEVVFPEDLSNRPGGRETIRRYQMSL